MIRPPGLLWAAFTEAADGDVRHDLQSRAQLGSTHGVPERWATLRQVHGDDVTRVTSPGPAGSADAMWTTELDLAIAVFTADCFGVVLKADHAVGVAHAGWRGVSKGVVSRLRSVMTEEGHVPKGAAIGPGIGPCCFEVGAEVAEKFEGFEASTSWGTTSVDLRAVLEAELDGLETWFSGGCTRHEEGYFSHRASGTADRMATLGWLP